MKFIFTIISIGICSLAQAQQNVGIGTNSPAASAMLHINSTSKGLLIPRLTAAQRTAIASPANGLQVYDTNSNSFWYYNSSAWVEMGVGGGGTSYWNDNGFGSIYNSNTQNVGIGTQFPSSKLTVSGDGGFTGSGITYEYSEQGGYYFSGGAINLTTAISGIESRAVRIDGSKIQSFTIDTDDPSADDFASALSINALGGNLGIGTSTPVANSKVTIQTDEDYKTALVIKNPAGSASFEAYVGGPANGNSISLGTQGAMPIAFFTNATNRLYINDDGNIGIGVNSPTFSKLEIRIADEQRGWAVGTNNYNMHTFLGGAGRSTNSEGCYLGTSGIVSGGAAVPLHFFTNAQWAQMTLLPNGNVGIGTTDPTYKLSVKGNIRSTEVVVESGWADYVFENNYQLLSLSETEKYINEHKHLPGIPAAEEIQTNGLSVGELQTKMMEKIEELTLHIIRQEKMITALQNQLKTKN